MPRRILALVLLFVALAASSCMRNPGAEQDSKELVLFRGPGFSVKLPGTPQFTTRNVQTTAGMANLRLFTVGSGAAAVTVGVTTLPRGVPIRLDDSLAQSAAYTQSQIVSSKEFVIDGHPGRDARFTGHNGQYEITMFCRVLAAKNRIVSVTQTVLGADVQQPPESYRKIVHSLKLT